ncbi:TPA: hypothetical protein I7722_01055 [Vibrio vulnificus]|nr:hypothetical protein [Vibrio vulnificus]
MSVDKLRGSYHVNRVSPNEIGLLLSAQSYRPAVTKAINKIKEGEWRTLQSLISNVISPGPHPKYDGSYPCLKTKNVQDLIADTSPADWADVSSINDLEKVQVGKGDLLINLTGAGSIGRVSVYYGSDLPITNQHIAKMSPNNLIDEGYLVAYLRSFYAERALEQGVAGSTGQINMVNEHVRCTPIRICHPSAQKYIGDKVRQANSLQILIKKTQNQLNQKAKNAEFDTILLQENVKYGFVTRKHLSTRLDPNYSNKRALRIIENIDKRSVPLSELAISVANGYEDRNFVENGLLYVTGTELSSGRLDTEEAPKIEHSIEIPQRVIANEKCVLFVRVGTVGKLGKVSLYDSGCVVSSNVIKVEFESQEIAAAVCAFYQSDAGQVLLKKISFGVIQSQIGQGELLGLPVPNYCLDKKSIFLKLMNLIEVSFRNQKNLLKFSKLLVEEVIDGQITEQQLVEAQQALEEGDDSLDRTLLKCMTAEGIDADSAPLFDDIDQLYDLLEQAKQAVDADDTMTEV